MAKDLRVYILLQLADVLTTVIFLSLGVSEGNPLIRFFIHHSNPIMGLMVVKLLAVAFGFYVVRTGRSLFKANIFFSFVICWNLVATLVAS